MSRERKHWSNAELISLFVNMSVASARIRRLTLHEKHGTHNLRPQINLLLASAIGSCKSTILSQITRENKLPEPFPDISFPGLVGSIDHNRGDVVPAAAWEFRNKILCIDEFNYKKDRTVTKALLQIMEGQTYTRKLARHSVPMEMKDKDLFFRVKDGTIELKTRLATIIGTMYVQNFIKHPQGEDMHALLSRTIPVYFTLQQDELYQIADGKILYRYKKFNPPQEIDIKRKDYNKIVDYVKSQGMSHELFLRTIGDCCRARAVLGRHDEEIYRLIAVCKKRRHELINPVFND